jgi:hypothetical protein
MDAGIFNSDTIGPDLNWQSFHEQIAAPHNILSKSMKDEKMRESLPGFL